MNSTVIKAEKLTKRYGDFVADNELPFDVRAGEIFGFLGANGAETTSAMRMLCGLSVRSSATASVAGYDVYKQTENIKRNIGYMSQKFSLYEDLTVMENIGFYAGIYGLTDKEIKEKSVQLVDQLGLHDSAKKLVRSLPLGWKQKLSFLVAIIHQPKIVFRDRKPLMLLFGLPVVQLTLFGFALTNEVKNTKIVVADYSKDIAKKQITEKIEASKYFDVEKSLKSHDEIKASFKTGKIKLAILFPENFNENLLHLHKAQIQIIADASDINTATTLTNYISAIVADYQRQLMKDASIPLTITPEIRMLYNPEL